MRTKFVLLSVAITAQTAAAQQHTGNDCAIVRQLLASLSARFNINSPGSSWYGNSTAEGMDCCDWKSGTTLQSGIQCAKVNGVDRIVNLDLSGSDVNVFGRLDTETYMRNLNQLINLDISNQPAITGGIPQWITDISTLSYVALSNNSLSGPVRLQTTKQLISLDVSRNSLSGQVQIIRPPNQFQELFQCSLAYNPNVCLGPYNIPWECYSMNQDLYRGKVDNCTVLDSYTMTYSAPTTSTTTRTITIKSTRTPFPATSVMPIPVASTQTPVTSPPPPAPETSTVASSPNMTGYIVGSIIAVLICCGIVLTTVVWKRKHHRSKSRDPEIIQVVVTHQYPQTYPAYPDQPMETLQVPRVESDVPPLYKETA